MDCFNRIFSQGLVYDSVNDRDRHLNVARPAGDSDPAIQRERKGEDADRVTGPKRILRTISSGS